MMLIALDKVQGCFRSPGARHIIGKSVGRLLFQASRIGAAASQSRFDRVKSMEQTRVPNHAVIEQFFIPCGRLSVAELVVTKVQLH